MRISDVVARYGGEEFVMVLPQTPLPMAAALCDREQHRGQLESIAEEYAQIRLWHAQKSDAKVLVSLQAARANALRTDWSNHRSIAPLFTGTRVLNDIPLDSLTPYFDWTPFFISWDLHGKYPKILQDEVVGEAALVSKGARRIRCPPFRCGRRRAEARF